MDREGFGEQAEDLGDLQSEGGRSELSQHSSHKSHVPADGWVTRQKREELMGATGGGDEGLYDRLQEQFGNSEVDRAEGREETVQIIGKMKKLGGHPPPHNYELRSQSTPRQLAMPLILKHGQREYRPFGFGDLTALMEKLPPLTEGGGAWLSTLNLLTQGQQLAMGDI